MVWIFNLLWDDTAWQEAPCMMMDCANISISGMWVNECPTIKSSSKRYLFLNCILSKKDYYGLRFSVKTQPSDRILECEIHFDLNQ